MPTLLLEQSRQGHVRCDLRLIVPLCLTAVNPLLAGAEQLTTEPESNSSTDQAVPDFSIFDSAAEESSPGGGMGGRQATSPLRVTLAHEVSYKVEEPQFVVKNRSSLRVEYSKYVLDNFYVQLDGKATGFWGEDHRHDAEGEDFLVSQAYVQTSFGRTAIRAGFQSLPWGESILAPITDEVSPRDNRELFNFNLEELRIGQPMLVVDQFSGWGSVSMFFNPRASFNRNPERGTAYSFDRFRYQPEVSGETDLSEYGASWRKTFTRGDITFMTASLIDNDYALRMNDDGTVSRERVRFSMNGFSFNYAFSDFVLRGEAAWKSKLPFNTAEMQIVERDAIEAYLGLEYSVSSTLTLSVEGINQHVSDWSAEVASAPRDSQSLLVTLTKLLMHEDLNIQVMNFYTQPGNSNLAILQTTYDWNDNLRFGFNVVYPYTRDEQAGLWNVRDQKQVALKVQYQF
ncbi:hypothetical protein [Steroidobacter cummioxidans]|uniref:hypothetical protein n=1 Tax=Steroidobacter cummioxidans TaxID=1803913 RepID=UPI001290352B|nr:hypothetical protein [Steroidobacter cummioxidans]